MNELIAALRAVHTSTFAFYFKAHGFHWNVEDKNFPMYHDFFGELYQEVFSAVDTLAELIRTLDEYAPGSINEVYSNSNIADKLIVGDAQSMVKGLFDSNQALLAIITRAYNLAEKYSEFGISNALQDRIEAHKKHAWMLRSMLKVSNNDR